MRGSGSELRRCTFLRFKHPGGFLEGLFVYMLYGGGPGRIREGTDLSRELLSRAEKHGEVSSPRGTSWQPGELQLIHHLSLAVLRCYQLQPASPGGRARAGLIPRSVCGGEGMELTLSSNLLPSTASTYSLISNVLKSQAGSFTRAHSPKERYWSSLFSTTIRRSLHKDSLFLLLWFAPIWPERSPYSEQWTSSSADKTNR